jgi:hypothetical protein
MLCDPPPAKCPLEDTPSKPKPPGGPPRQSPVHSEAKRANRPTSASNRALRDGKTPKNKHATEGGLISCLNEGLSTPFTAPLLKRGRSEDPLDSDFPVSIPTLFSADGSHYSCIHSRTKATDERPQKRGRETTADSDESVFLINCPVGCILTGRAILQFRSL